MAEFGAAATLSLEVPDSELRAARREIESELGDLEVSIDATASGGTTGRPTGDNAEIDRHLTTANDVLDDLDELAIERNNLLRELIDETEQGNRARGRGRGGAFGAAGGGLLALLGIAGGAGALGLAGLVEALEGFEFPDLPDLEFPDGIPLTGVPDEIPVDAPTEIPVDAPKSIPLTTPFPIPIPVANAVIDIVDTTLTDPEPTPGPEPSPGPSPDPDPSPGGATDIPGQLIEGPSPSPTPVGEPVAIDLNELNARPDEPVTQPALTSEAAAVGAGGGLAGGLTAAAARFLPGPDASPSPGRFGVPTPAIPAFASVTERGREFFGDLARNFPGSGDSGGGGPPPVMSTSPLAAASMAGGGGGDTGGAPENRSTTQRRETTVKFEVDARNSRNTQETIREIKRKLPELERRLKEVEDAGQGGLVR